MGGLPAPFIRRWPARLIWGLLALAATRCAPPATSSPGEFGAEGVGFGHPDHASHVEAIDEIIMAPIRDGLIAGASVAVVTQGNRITVRELLDHTSGIRGYTEMAAARPYFVRRVPRDSLLVLIADHPFDFPTGEHAIYNNSAYYLAGMILEQVSGMRSAATTRGRTDCATRASSSTTSPSRRGRCVPAQVIS